MSARARFERPLGVAIAAALALLGPSLAACGRADSGKASAAKSSPSAAATPAKTSGAKTSESAYGPAGYSWADDPLRKSGTLWRRARASVPAPPAPPARAWILLDSASGDVLAASNARKRLPPASTLKTLTAVTLMPRLNPSEVYTATAADVGIEGSGAGLVRGGTYTVEQLFIGLLLPSGNDAAVALTHAYHPSTSRAITLMNTSAKRLGALHTVVRNPHGLPNDEQVTTVADMALIGNAAIHLRQFRKVAHLKTYQFPSTMPKPGKPRGSYQLQNENPLIKHGVKGTLGGKTGYTRKALRTYWGAVKRSNRTLVIVMFGYVGPTYNYANSLLNWGFAHADDLKPVGHLPTQIGNQWQSEAVPAATAALVNASAPAPVVSTPSALATTRPASRSEFLSTLDSHARRATTWVLFILPVAILARRAIRHRNVGL